MWRSPHVVILVTDIIMLTLNSHEYGSHLASERECLHRVRERQDRLCSVSPKSLDKLDSGAHVTYNSDMDLVRSHRRIALKALSTSRSSLRPLQVTHGVRLFE